MDCPIFDCFGDISCKDLENIWANMPCSIDGDTRGGGNINLLFLNLSTKA